MNERYEGDERRVRERWRITKEVSLGDLIAFVMAFVSVVYAYTTLDKRIAVVEDKFTNQRDTDNRQDADSVRYQARIDATLSSISAKLDRLIETRR